MLIRTRRPWELPGLQPTPEHVYLHRRQFLARLGLGSIVALAVGPVACGQADDRKTSDAPRTPDRDTRAGGAAKLYPARRNPKFVLPGKLTDEKVVTSFNNFYEFSFRKDLVKPLCGRLETSPWKIEIAGLVEKPFTLDVDDLLKRLPLEERLYRFRCVEAWAMDVPWTGIPLKRVIELAKPLAAAKFVRMETFNRPDWGAGFSATEYPWPYHEGLTIGEATNELAFLATGLYGKPLPKQNGAPARLVVPWKYGFKSIKSIVKIEFTAARPKTFWHTAIPHEYGFVANVDPGVPHPRWSQRTEWMIDTRDVRPTQPYNGYGEYVAKLYPKRKLREDG